jgi:hypothetical protein
MLKNQSHQVIKNDREEPDFKNNRSVIVDSIISKEDLRDSDININESELKHRKIQGKDEIKVDYKKLNDYDQKILKQLMKEDFIQAESLREAMHSEFKNEKRSIFETSHK